MRVGDGPSLAGYAELYGMYCIGVGDSSAPSPMPWALPEKLKGTDQGAPLILIEDLLHWLLKLFNELPHLRREARSLYGTFLIWQRELLHIYAEKEQMNMYLLTHPGKSCPT